MAEDYPPDDAIAAIVEQVAERVVEQIAALLADQLTPIASRLVAIEEKAGDLAPVVDEMRAVRDEVRAVRVQIAEATGNVTGKLAVLARTEERQSFHLLMLTRSSRRTTPRGNDRC